MYLLKKKLICVKIIKQIIYIGTAMEEFVTLDKVIREELTEPIFEK